MKFHLPAKTLRQALDRMVSLPGKSPTSEGVRIVADEFEGLQLTRITPEGRMQVSCPAMVSGESVAIVSLEKLRALAGQSGTEELSFQVSGDKLQCQTQHSRITLKLWDKNEWPTREIIPPAGSRFMMPCQDFLKRAKAAAKAQYNGTERASLAGVCLREMDGFLAILAGDGRRLHLIYGPKIEDRLSGDLDGAYDKGVLLSKQILSCLDAMLDGLDGALSVEIESHIIQFSAGGNIAQLALPTDTPPDFRAHAKPVDYDISFQVKRSDLLSAARSAIPFANDSTTIYLFPGPKECRLEADNQTITNFQTSVALTKGCKDCRLIINAGFLVDFLESLEGEEVEIGYRRDIMAVCARESDRFLVITLMKRDDQPMP